MAGFFLKKMRNPHSDVNDLVTLDPELYRNLMFMRDYDGDFADLALTFTTADSDVTHTREVGTQSRCPPRARAPCPSTLFCLVTAQVICLCFTASCRS